MYKLIRNARVLTLDAAATEHDCADILINGATIEAIGSRLEVPQQALDPGIIDARGMLVMPGLINAHLHSTSAFMKGTLEGAHLEPFMLFESPLDKRWETRRLYYLRTMLTAMDMLKAGVTSARDDAHFFSHPDAPLVDGIFEAFRDAGMRASVALGMTNAASVDTLPFYRELLTDAAASLLPPQKTRPGDELLEVYRSVAQKWHGAADGRLTLHGSCSAPQRVTADYLQALSAFCVDHDMSLDMHVLETRTQRVHGELVHGKSFVHYVNELGALNENSVLVHCVWVDEQDIELIAAANAVVAHNPISNLRLGSGVMPFNAIANRGIALCLGSDEPAVDESSSLWANARTGALLQKINSRDDAGWPEARKFLAAICNGGARAMRRADVTGSVEVGKEADLIFLDTSSLVFVPHNDVYRHLVYGENGSSVRLTMVAGEVVYRDGKLLTIDEEAIKAEINALWPDYRRACDRANRHLEPLIDVHRAIVARCVATDVGFSRWLADPPAG